MTKVIQHNGKTYVQAPRRHLMPGAWVWSEGYTVDSRWIFTKNKIACIHHDGRPVIWTSGFKLIMNAEDLYVPTQGAHA